MNLQPFPDGLRVVLVHQPFPDGVRVVLELPELVIDVLLQTFFLFF
jgi:hypothetical protein